MHFDSKFWALIIGGSSGFGLAAARKLAAHGMNICIVHRDRRAAMRSIQESFGEIAASGAGLLTYNLDALTVEGRRHVLDGLREAMGGEGRVRLLLHAVAFGNLKLLAPWALKNPGRAAREQLYEKTGISNEEVRAAIRNGLDKGLDALASLDDPPCYNERQFLDAGDFARTIHAMGTNIVEWVGDVFSRGLFAGDARVLSLTSEGNSIAWRGYAAVSAAKAALESVTRAMAVEYAPHGIRANVIQAGVTDTAAMRAIPGSQQIKSRARLRNPMARLTTPEDVADVIFLLCLKEAAWINGALLCVDGGERIA
ncbi:MAG: SDR family oxidoreductase [Thermodesulfobacteriota bacterium]